MVSAALLPDLGTEVVIPVCAIIGIAFSLIQRFLVWRTKVTHERGSSDADHRKGGYSDSLIEEEEGINVPGVVVKCAEIQNAISEG